MRKIKKSMIVFALLLLLSSLDIDDDIIDSDWNSIENPKIIISLNNYINKIV